MPRLITVTSVRDSATQAFSQPMFVPSPAFGLRAFSDEVNRADPSNQLYRHPGDYELWVIGYFDEDSGTFLNGEGDAGRRCLARGVDVQVKPE